MHLLASQSGDGTPTQDEQESSACMSARLNQQIKVPLRFEIKLDLKSLGYLVINRLGVGVQQKDKPNNNQSGSKTKNPNRQQKLEDKIVKFDFESLGESSDEAK